MGTKTNQRMIYTTVTSHTFGIESGHKAALLCQLPEDVLCKVTSFLDANSLREMRRLNRKFRRSASKNSAGWDYLCRHLWKNKIHVCQQAQEERRHSSNRGSHDESSNKDESAMSAYRIPLLDGRNRDHLTREELIFDPDRGRGSVWSFRFKEAAGSDWTAFDPWYKYQPCRKMVFLEDGKVKMYVTRKKTCEGKEQHMTNMGKMGAAGRNINESSGEGQLENMETEDSTIWGASLLDPRYNQVRPENGVNDAHPQDPAVPMTWRFVNQALDLPDRPVGSYIRFSVRGREVPTYVCRRSPTNN